MRILVISPSYWPATDLGGPIFSLHALNKALVKKGIDVTVYTTDVRLKGKVSPNQEVIIDGIKITYFSFSNILECLAPTGWQFSMPMRQALKKNINRFDIVYILSVWNYPVIMAASICRRFHKPYIISPRGLLYPETFRKKMIKKRFYYNLLAKKNIKEAAAVHYTSCDEAEKCHSSLGLKNKFIVVPNGINLSEFSNLPDKDEFRLRYPVLKNKKIILFLGRISWKKGLDILIKAFNALSKKRDGLHLVITGGDDEDYKKKVMGWVDKFGLQDKVIFTGILNDREKLAAYSGSDIFVLPSYSENFGMTVVEAMVCGLPVVISDKVGLCRVVKDKNSGIIVEANAESVYNGIKKLLEDEGLGKEIAENAKLLVKEYYDIDKVADKMVAAYNKILKVN